MARPRNWIAVHAHNRRSWRKENKRLEPEVDPEDVELGRIEARRLLDGHCEDCGGKGPTCSC